MFFAKVITEYKLETSLAKKTHRRYLTGFLIRLFILTYKVQITANGNAFKHVKLTDVLLTEMFNTGIKTKFEPPFV